MALQCHLSAIPLNATSLCLSRTYLELVLTHAVSALSAENRVLLHNFCRKSFQTLGVVSEKTTFSDFHFTIFVVQLRVKNVTHAIQFKLHERRNKKPI